MIVIEFGHRLPLSFLGEFRRDLLPRPVAITFLIIVWMPPVFGQTVAHESIETQCQSHDTSFTRGSMGKKDRNHRPHGRECYFPVVCSPFFAANNRQQQHKQLSWSSCHMPMGDKYKKWKYSSHLYQRLWQRVKFLSPFWTSLLLPKMLTIWDIPTILIKELFIIIHG